MNKPSSTCSSDIRFASKAHNSSVVFMTAFYPAGRRIDFQWKHADTQSKSFVNTMFFEVMQMSCFVQKTRPGATHASFSHRTRTSQIVNPQPSHYTAVVGTALLQTYFISDLFGNCSELVLLIQTTDYRSNFPKTILFENCSCFSKIPFSISVEFPRIFQCLISIPAGH